MDIGNKVGSFVEKYGRILEFITFVIGVVWFYWTVNTEYQHELDQNVLQIKGLIIENEKNLGRLEDYLSKKEQYTTVKIISEEYETVPTIIGNFSEKVLSSTLVSNNINDLNLLNSLWQLSSQIELLNKKIDIIPRGNGKSEISSQEIIASNTNLFDNELKSTYEKTREVRLLLVEYYSKLTLNSDRYDQVEICPYYNTDSVVITPHNKPPNCAI